MRDISTLIQVREQIEKEALDTCVPIVKREVGQLLSVLVRTAKARTVLEIGTAVGYSTLWLAEGLVELEGKIVTVERDQRRVEIAKNNFRRAGIDDLIELHNCDASSLLSGLDSFFDCIFLDSAKGKYIEYLPYCLNLLNPGGILIADNVLFRGMVTGQVGVPRRYKTMVRKLQEFLNQLQQNERLITTVLNIGDGVTISVRR